MWRSIPRLGPWEPAMWSASARCIVVLTLALYCTLNGGLPSAPLWDWVALGVYGR